MILRQQGLKEEIKERICRTVDDNPVRNVDRCSNRL